MEQTQQKQPRMLLKEQEAFKKEIMGLFTDVSRQSRKVVLEFVCKRLTTKGGEYWDTERMLREINKLTEAKHGVKIPMADVGQIHFKGDAGCCLPLAI